MELKKKNNLAKIALGSIVLALSTSVIAHLVRPEASIVKQSLSNYATSKYGFISSAGFLLYALANALIAIILKDFKHWRFKVGSILFCLCCVNVIVLTIFYGNGDGIIETWNEYVHLIAAILAFIIWPIAIFLISPCFKAKNLRLYSYISFVVISILSAWGIIFTLSNLTSGDLQTTYIGIIQKSGTFLIVLWMIIFLLKHENLQEPFPKTSDNSVYLATEKSLK